MSNTDNYIETKKGKKDTSTHVKKTLNVKIKIRIWDVIPESMFQDNQISTSIKSYICNDLI